MSRSSEILYSEGKNDEWRTPDYVVRAIAKYLPKLQFDGTGGSTRITEIWCPFDINGKSEFIKILKEKGFIVHCSHILTGQDFLSWEPDFNWDIIVSNPPFTNKRKFFERAMELGKPFALLMSNTWLNDSAPKQVIGNELELLMFDERINYIDGTSGELCRKGITFSSSYFCRGILPRAIICESLKNYR